jgi:antitoxin component YwqK of YwqJK toxin-antitoxin module
MNRLLLIVLPILLIVGCSSPEPINYETTLIERDGVFYTKDTNKPYSGPVFSLNDRGLIKRESILQQGKMIIFTDFEWYENGQKESEVTHKDRFGNKHGLSTLWYENGQKKGEGSFKDNKSIYLKFWNEDGSVQK